ncbi:MAG: hypothetical protein OEW05_09770 [Candidatus Aminicenantes bacterium]|nr:hypothetical protein [Candidatus Aminicenantes bacterium]
MRRSWTASIVFVVAAALFLPTAAAEDVIQSAWADKIPKIDGATDDWTDVTPASWAKGRVTCAFRNNAESLYVLLVIADPKLRSTIEATGVTLYFSPEGKKEDYGVHFLKKTISAEEAIAVQEKQTPLTEEQKTQMRAKPAYNFYFSEVVNKKAGSPAPPDGTAGRPALFRYAPDKRSLVYEFIIPLARAEEWAAGVGAGLGQTVMVGFEWGGMTDAMRQAAARQQGGGSNIANEELGRLGGSSMPQSGRAPAKHTYWGQVKLAAGTS